MSANLRGKPLYIGSPTSVQITKNFREVQVCSLNCERVKRKSLPTSEVKKEKSEVLKGVLGIFLMT